MSKYKINLNDKQVELLNKILSNDKSPNLLKRKSMVILLRNEGTNIKIISDNVGVSVRTAKDYIKGYALNGIRYISTRHYKQSELDRYNGDITDTFLEKQPVTYTEASHIIEIRWGITRSDSSIRKYLNKLGIHSKNSRIKRDSN